MSTPGIVVGLVGVAVGTAMIAAARSSLRQPEVDLSAYVDDIDIRAGPLDDFERRLAEPFRVRVLRELSRAVLNRLTGIMPRNYVDGVHDKLVQAGEAGTRRAEALVIEQVLLGAGLLGLALVYVLLGRPPPRSSVAALVLLPIAGFLGPQARLNRAVAARKASILADLPDTLDLLAISVEAGMGFEGALDVVCRNFQSPLADEFSLTLREMELGLPRRDAFQNLKQRTQVAELSTFILALLQGDALGIPIGRVLKTQGAEMRAKRRMWAREKAGKLPVKMLFPLMLFIFPPIMVVVVGPAASSISKGLR